MLACTIKTPYLWQGLQSHASAVYIDGHPAFLNSNAPLPAGQPLLARASKLPAATRFRAAAFVPPGYGSLFFAHLYEDASCPHPTELFTRFRSWALRPLGLLRGAASLEQALVRVRSVTSHSKWSGGRRGGGGWQLTALQHY